MRESWHNGTESETQERRTLVLQVGGKEGGRPRLLCVERQVASLPQPPGLSLRLQQGQDVSLSHGALKQPHEIKNYL
jgi:hypothetical protein